MPETLGYISAIIVGAIGTIPGLFFLLALLLAQNLRQKIVTAVTCGGLASLFVQMQKIQISYDLGIPLSPIWIDLVVVVPAFLVLAYLSDWIAKRLPKRKAGRRFPF